MKVLFLCRGNVGRSTFAINLYNKITATNDAESAGTKLSGQGDTLDELRPLTDNVIAVMQEEGIDVSQHKRKPVTQTMVEEADMIVCMAEPETVPEFVSQHPNCVTWNIADPKGTDLDTHRNIKNEIKNKITETFI